MAHRERRRWWARSDEAGSAEGAHAGAHADEVAVRQIGAIADRLKVPAPAREILLGAATVLADASREAWADAGRTEPARPRARPRVLADGRRLNERALRAAEALRPLLDDAERLAITAGVLWPLPAARYRGAEPVTAGALTFAAALSEEAVAVASFGASLASLVATIPVLEILETYLAASARTNVYRRAELGYDVPLVTADLHAGLTGASQGHSARLGVSALIAELVDRAVKKIASRVWQVVVLGVGAAWAGAGAARRVAMVASLPVIRDATVVTPRPPEGPTRQRVVDALRDRIAGRPGVTLPGVPT